MHIKFLLEKLEEKRPLGSPRNRWEDKMRMDLSEIGWEGVDWSHLVQERDQRWDLVNITMNIWVP
jgi:hypothetical protein